MKRLICLFLVLCMILAGCGKKEAAAPTGPVTEAPTTEATVAPTTEAPTEATEPEPTDPIVYVNPLTGVVLEEEYTGRPVSFTINNAPACLPQYGLDDLDWMFEAETEGGVTRCVGLMTDPSKADVVGPVRSCRTYFLNLSVSYNAPLFHCGGSKFADANQYSASSALNTWDHINEKAYAKYFYRDSYRYNTQGYAWEHTLFTNGELMTQAVNDLGYTDGGSFQYGYQFSDSVDLDGQDANTVVVRFLGTKDTTMKYDAETGLYKAHQQGKDWIDGSTGENATFRNLLVVFVPQSKIGSGHSFYELGGSGDGYFAVDGKMVPVKWQHEDAKGPFSFTVEDGTPITLGVGSTYCAIVSTKGSVTAE